jgi:hypothetical protein
MNIVEQIHNEFNTAQDKLIMSVPNSSAETLYKLGFYKSKSAESYDPSGTWVKECAQYFKSRYPQYKFISEKQVENICKKYNLVLTTVDRYTGTVPHSKVAEIASFKLRTEDLRNRSINEWGMISHDEVSPFHLSTGEPAFSGHSEFWICAPITDVDTEGLTAVGHNISEVRTDDPVVLQPVEGGFIIVAAWGPEASDENVVNEKMN